MRGRRWLRAAPWLAAAACALALAGPEAVRGDWLAYRDAADYLYPNEVLLRDAAGRLALPHWNPWIHGGVPHLADPPTQALYPPRWATALLPLARAPHVFLLLHLLLAGAGAARLARALGARTAGQCLAAAACPASGFVVSLEENLPALAGATWLPWSLALALELARAAPSGAPRRELLLGAAGALALLGGDPQAAATAALGAGALLAVEAGPRRALVRGLRAAVLALGLAAPLLVPAHLLAPHTSRALPFLPEVATLWSTSPWRAVELWAPWPFAAPWPDPFQFLGRALVEGDRTELFADSLYPGALVPLLAASAVLLGGARARARRALALLALATVVVALGRHTPLHAWLLGAVPGFDRLRYPEKWLLLGAVVAPALAGVGLAPAAGRATRGRRIVGWAALGLGLLLGTRPLAARLADVLALTPLGAHALATRLGAGALRFFAVTSAAALLVRVADRRAGRARLALLLLAAAVAAGDAFEAARGRRWVDAAPPWEGGPCLAALARCAGSPGADGLPGRAARWPADAGPHVRAGEGYVRARRRATTRGGAGHEVAWAEGFASFVPLRVHEARSLDPALRWRLLGVRALLAEADAGSSLPPWAARLEVECPERGWRVLELGGASDVAWCVPRAATALARSAAEAIELASRPGFVPAAHAVLEGAPRELAPAAPAAAWPPPGPALAARVQGRALPGGELELVVEAPEPVTLVVAVAPFPGWRADVGGASRPVYPASALDLGVPLEAGTHRVLLTFSTPGLVPGALLGLAALALGLARVVTCGHRARGAAGRS